MSATNSLNRLNRLNTRESPGIVKEIIFGLVLVISFYILLMSMEILYKYMNRMSMNRVELLPYTYNTEEKTITIPQNPNIVDSKTVYVSDNERSGIEFSYAFYLLVHPSTFKQGDIGLLHIFHKGYSKQFPLLAPGVYMRSDKNTLRVYMNTYKTWNNFMEVENIPVGKWVHVVIACKEKSLEIFINGNLTKKTTFDGYIPYQNYQDITCFSQRVLKLPTGLDSEKQTVAGVSAIKECHALIDSAFEQCTIQVFGCMKGMLSRLTYFSYALCYAEIQKLMEKGSSSKLDPSLSTTNIPPYLDDTWWSKGY